jgi:hypothetical protein
MDPTAEQGGLTTLLNRRVATITAVAAGALTFAAATFTAEAIPTGANVYRVQPLTQATIPVGSGLAGKPINLLTPNLMDFLANKPDTNMMVGPKGILFASIITTALAAGECLTVTTEGGDY